MKLVVVSDNHGDTDYMEEIQSVHEADTDGWFHCGDSELTEKHPLFQQYKTVRGNMDITNKLKLSRVETLQEINFLIAHGHKHSVKRSYEKLKDEALKNDAKFVFYGHTHKPKIEVEDGIFFANPGSITQPRDRQKGTYLIVEINEDKSDVTFTFFDQDHTLLHELTQTFALN